MKRIKALDKFQINVNSLRESEKYIYKKLDKTSYNKGMKDFFKIILIEDEFSEIFFKDFFSVLFSINNYDFNVMSLYHETYFTKL